MGIIDIDLTGFIVPLIKYIHLNSVKKKLQKTRFENDKKAFIMRLNHFVLQEKKILYTLIDNGNVPIESNLTHYINRLIQSQLLYEIPNSEQSLYDRNYEKSKANCAEEGHTLLAFWQNAESSPKLFELNFDAYEVLKHLKESKAIFEEFVVKEQNNE